MGNQDPDLSRDFMLTRLNTTHIQDLLREEFIKNGPSSLFRYHITCDSILHPGITVDEVEIVILGFIRTLKGVKNLRKVRTSIPRTKNENFSHLISMGYQ